MTVGGRTLFGLSGTEGFSWSASYGYLKAEYESDFDLVSDGNDSRSTVTTSYSGLMQNHFGRMALNELGEEVMRYFRVETADTDLAALAAALFGRY